MTIDLPNLLASASRLLDAAAEKETGQAIAARNDLARAQVYALADIAASLRLIAANTTPAKVTAPDQPTTGEPEVPEVPADQAPDAPTDTAETEPPTDAQLPG